MFVYTWLYLLDSRILGSAKAFMNHISWKDQKAPIYALLSNDQEARMLCRNYHKMSNAVEAQ